MGRYCSYLLPKQTGGTTQILVFKTLRMIDRPALYITSDVTLDESKMSASDHSLPLQVREHLASHMLDILDPSKFNEFRGDLIPERLLKISEGRRAREEERAQKRQEYERMMAAQRKKVSQMCCCCC